jgi:hypothetical protein
MRIFWRVAVVLVLIAAIAGLGAYAYSLGVAHGAVQNVTPPTTGSTTMPYGYYWPPYFGMWHGFGFLGCLIPLFLLFLVFGSMRMLFWGGPMGWRRHMMHRHWGRWQGEEGKGVPPFFEEWHRRAHGEPPSDQPSEKQ